MKIFNLLRKRKTPPTGNYVKKMKKIKVCADGHFSAVDDLESKLWIWYLEIQGIKVSYEEMLKHALEKEKGVEFIKALKKYLPSHKELIATYKILPASQTGDSATFGMDIKDMKNPEEALKVVQKFFPGLCAMIK